LQEVEGLLLFLVVEQCSPLFNFCTSQIPENNNNNNVETKTSLSFFFFFFNLTKLTTVGNKILFNPISQRHYQGNPKEMEEVEEAKCHKSRKY
jgi:hypothetical protein